MRRCGKNGAPEGIPSLTLAFGAYGIKGNTGYTAWIDDLGLPVYGWKRGVHEGRSLAALTDKYSVPAVRYSAKLLQLAHARQPLKLPI
jgi:hypothetical protein